MVMDPACCQIVDESTTPYRFQYEGTTYYFCSEKCMTNFEREPEFYLRDLESRKRSWEAGEMIEDGGF